MRSLEPIEESATLTQVDVRELNVKVLPLISLQDAIISDLNSIEKTLATTKTDKVKEIFKTIYDYNKELLIPNYEAIEECICRGDKISKDLDCFHKNNSGISPVKPKTDFEDLNKKLLDLKIKTIERIERLDLPKFCEIKVIHVDCEDSFHKIWIFILETYFGNSSNKYEWRDFSRRLFSKKYDSGKEFKRRLIVLDSETLSKFQIKEFSDLVYTHSELIREKMNDPILLEFLETFKMINTQLELTQKIKGMKNKSVNDDQIKTVEEEEKILNAALQLNQKKFDIVTETQNLYSFINSYLK